MAAAGEKTLAHSELKRSLIGAFCGAFIRALSLVYSFQNKDGGSLRALWSLRSAFFGVWDQKGGQNSRLIVWKTVTVPLEGKDSKIVSRFNSCFHRCSAHTRSSFSQTSCYIYLQMRTISYEISEMVIARNITRHRGISVARAIAICFVCSKLLKICFFDSQFVKEYLQGFNLSINLAVRLQRFSTVLTFVFFEQ